MDLAKAEAIAEELRRELYRLFRNDCFIKSLRFKQRCHELGIPARAVVCIGLGRARWLGHWLTIPVLHGWGEVEDKRMETSRPLGASGTWGIIPMNIKPLIKIRI